MAALTPNSSAAAYLSAAEFLKRADVRTVGDLCSDSGTRVTAAALLTDDNLAAALLDASGLFEAACLRGGRYQAADLNTLVGTASAGQALVYRLLADVTTVLLFERRPDLGPTPDRLKWAGDFLKSLADGEQVLPFVETQQAGQLHADRETARVVEDRYLVSVDCQELFGRRNNRTPNWPWG